MDLDFSLIEMNPFTLDKEGRPFPLDMRGELDDTAAFKSRKKWGELEFPLPFGRSMTSAEEYVHEMDEKTGASLKLSILNPKVWNPPSPHSHSFWGPTLSSSIPSGAFCYTGPERLGLLQHRPSDTRHQLLFQVPRGLVGMYQSRAGLQQSREQGYESWIAKGKCLNWKA